MNEIQIEKSRSVFREMIVNEEVLISRRLSWLIQIQAFLFAGVYASIDKNLIELRGIISVLAIVFSIFILSALVAAVKAVEKIKDEWRKMKPDEYNGPDIIGIEPTTKKYDRILPYLSSENMIPVTFIIIWVAFWVKDVFFDSIYKPWFNVTSTAVISFVIVANLLFWNVFKNKK